MKTLIRALYPYLFMVLILLVFCLVGNEDVKTEAEITDFLNSSTPVTVEKTATGHPAVLVFWRDQ